jgi:aspartate dehydrogenase
MIRVGIIGTGTIGSELALQCITTLKEEVRLVGIVDTDVQRERLLRKQLGLSRRYTLEQLVPQVDLVIEAASAAAAYPIAKTALQHGKDVMIMSAGGLVHHEAAIWKLAAEHRSCVYLPSGAIAGLDGLKSASIGRIRKVSLTTRKNPLSFRNAPYIVQKRIDLNTIREETLLFDGTAEKAIQGFPQNINVSATLSMAGIGSKKTRVRIYACPGLTHHVHEVAIDGDFGSIYTRTQNLPSKKNPKTSHLAILSAVATLKRILANIKIGT